MAWLIFSECSRITQHLIMSGTRLAKLGSQVTQKETQYSSFTDEKKNEGQDLPTAQEKNQFIECKVGTDFLPPKGHMINRTTSQSQVAYDKQCPVNEHCYGLAFTLAQWICSLGECISKLLLDGSLFCAILFMALFICAHPFLHVCMEANDLSQQWLPWIGFPFPQWSSTKSFFP